MTAAKPGPLESRPWPTTLEAYAVDDRDECSLHGYRVVSDLARHYRFSDSVYLSLTGELPTDVQSRSFEVALIFAMEVSVAQAGVHAAALAALMGSPPSGILAAATVTLAQDAVRVNLEVAAAEERGTLDDAQCATDERERRSVVRLRELLAGFVDPPLLAQNPSREVALVVLLRGCGLQTPLAVSSALAVARIGVAAAEASPRVGQNFVEKYPLDTPPIHYEK